MKGEPHSNQTLDETERLARANRFRQEAERMMREENERLEREAALARCDQCPHVKQERNEEITLPTGLRLSLYTTHCESPAPECTACVQSHILSESPEISNRIIRELIAIPEMQSIGVSCMACLSPDSQHILTYRVPALERVIAELGGTSKKMPLE